MSALVLDAGAFIAVERNDRAMLARLRVAHASGLALRTTGIVVAEVWRGQGGRQANLARLLAAIDVRSVDTSLGKQAGTLLAAAGTDDPVDATVIAVAAGGDRIVTSDPVDIRRLVEASGRAVLVIPL
jgi:hypothetical protein